VSTHVTGASHDPALTLARSHGSCPILPGYESRPGVPDHRDSNPPVASTGRLLPGLGRELSMAV
jgi:hypothetical protein